VKYITIGQAYTCASLSYNEGNCTCAGMLLHCTGRSHRHENM